jgi:hypothetical protein
MPSAERPPFEAYKGPKPFVFVSYAHKDSSLVFPELVKLSSWGFNIWYDEGIDPGNEWPDEIAQALKNSAYFIFFVSGNSANSVNCRNEVYYAQNSRKPFLCIYLEETALDEINPGLALSIGSLQAVMRYQMDDESYKRKICKALASLAPSESQPLLPVSTKPDSSSGTLSRRGSSSFVLRKRLLLAGTLVVGLTALSLYVTTDKDGYQLNKHYSLPPPPPPPPVPGQGWVNSLGLKFIPCIRRNVFFCQDAVRVKDFVLYAESKKLDWKPREGATATDLAGGMTWDQADGFCKWLTDKERAIYKVNLTYRLPKDEEWSLAVGLTEGTGTPEDKDTAARTSGANEPITQHSYILDDVSGSAVWQWCIDKFTTPGKYTDVRDEWYVLRGGPGSGLSFRNHDKRDNPNGDHGCRMILEIDDLW